MSYFISLFGFIEFVIIAGTLFFVWRNRTSWQIRKQILIGGTFLLALSLASSWRAKNERDETRRSIIEQYKLSGKDMDEIDRQTDDAIDEARQRDSD